MSETQNREVRVAEANGTRAWSIAFWIMSGLVIFTIGTSWSIAKSLSDAIVCNDRLRQQADADICAKVEGARVERMVQFKELTEKMDRNNSEVVQRLTRIETKIEKI